MSLVKAKSDNCACQENASTGTMRLRIVPQERDLREKAKYDETLQLMHAERLQNMFAPTLGNVNMHTHDNGFHAHPEQPQRVAHMQHLHDEMDKQGLMARLSIAAGGDHSAVNVALARDHVSDMLREGVVDIGVPCSDHTLRLHSTRKGRITGVEYRPV